MYVTTHLKDVHILYYSDNAVKACAVTYNVHMMQHKEQYDHSGTVQYYSWENKSIKGTFSIKGT